MVEKLEVEYHTYTDLFGGSKDRPAHRAMIRFAPGPHGTLFTDSYTGKKGVEMVVEALRSAISNKVEVVEK